MNEIQRNMEVVRRWWWLILLAAFLGGACAYVGTKVLVTQKYQATAIVAMGPAPQIPNGLYVALLSAATDAQLVGTQVTAAESVRLLSPSARSQVDAATLAGDTEGLPSVDGQLLYVSVKSTSQALSPLLANAVANTFIAQERARLQRRYLLIHQGVTAQEQRLNGLARTSQGNGQAGSWLRAQYADSVARLTQQDMDIKIQATVQQASLQVVQPASGTTKTGPKALLNAVLGAALGLLIGLVTAFAASSSGESEDGTRQLQPVLTRVGE